jgi:hypothetical protein
VSCHVISSLVFIPEVSLNWFCRFLELSAALEPGRPPKTDKATILCDAVRILTQLRSEAQQLQDSNNQLRDAIKDLKVQLPTETPHACAAISWPLPTLLLASTSQETCYEQPCCLWFVVYGSFLSLPHIV